MFNHMEVIEQYLIRNYIILIFDTASKSVVWHSFDCEDSNCSCSVSDYETLETCLQISLCNRERFRQFMNGFGLNKPNETVFIDTNNIIYLDSTDDRYLVLRSERTNSTDLAHSRYLRDREKLLYTSRSISVSEMASTLAHEINQPMGTITNLLNGIKSRMQRSDVDNEDVLGALQQAIDQSMFISSIISRVRDYTQTRQPQKNQVNISTLISKCVSLMDWEIKNTCVEIQTVSTIQNVTVMGDELMLQQVIINLIRNGIDATSVVKTANSRITISANQDNNYVRISIRDNGKGLNDDEEQSLFIPFSSNKSNGMGIGLNICRTFIELHMGKLWLTKNEESGCTSHIMLPISP